jgi:hypothetical protein
VHTGALNWRAAPYYSFGDPLVYEDNPPSSLGSRYTIIFSTKATNARVVQHLYPCAGTRPWTFTPAGQHKGFWNVFGEREISGWWEAPERVQRVFERRGIDCPAASIPRRFF